MHKLPQRKIKSRLRLLIAMVIIFLLTILLCSGFFLYSIYFGFHIISPLTAIKHAMSNQQLSASLQAQCDTKHISCSNIQVLPDGTMQFTIQDNIYVLFSAQKDISSQLASLQRVASQLTIKGKTIKKIDFRFDNVVVSF